MTEDQFKQPTESQPGTTQEELTTSTPVDEPGTTTDGEHTAGGEQAGGGQQAEGAHARQAAADDFRDSLSNLSSAFDRFGKAAEARVRLELDQGRPEINRTVDEMKRGLDGLIRKSGGLLDSLTRRLSKDDETSARPEAGQSSTTEYRVDTDPTSSDAASGETPQGETVAHRVETEPSATADLPGHGDISGHQHSSPVDFPPPAASEPATTASQPMSTDPDVAPAPPRDADQHP